MAAGTVGTLLPATVVSAWRERRERGPLRGWLDRELDDEGTPRRLPLTAWWDLLAALAELRRGPGPAWNTPLDRRAVGLFRAALRFSRPDGAAIFSGRADRDRTGLIRAWADWLDDPALRTVVRWWFPTSSSRRDEHAPPPLPAWSSPDRVLAMLRADWSTRGDLLAIDHRDRATGSLIELFGQGRAWLGPCWSSGLEPGPTGPARPALWQTGPNADLLEWRFRQGTARVTRTVLLLRGRGLALLADQVSGPEPVSGLTLDLAPDLEVVPVAESRSLALKTPRGPAAQVLPIGLPALPYQTERGSFSSETGRLVLRQRGDSRRRWLPLVVSWRAERNRKPVHWRVLTVSEKSRVCPPGVAFAARVVWGAGEGLVFYRSLARPAPRAFLGHRTESRFLVGLFTKAGNVEPLVEIEE